MRRLLIIGCGDVALRMVRLLRGRYRLYALSHSTERHALLRGRGIIPLPGDLDKPTTLSRLAGLPHDIVHAAPPPATGSRDSRTKNLIRALRRSESLPQRLVYISTSGVYGDCAGALVEEHRTLNPESDRGRRRVDAERQLREWGKVSGVNVVILRVPGIYAGDRLPLERVRSGVPVLNRSEDSYTNHVHADDLARIALIALYRGRNGRAYNASDGSWLKMGDYFDLIADQFGLAKPPRITREEAASRLSAASLSFMRESRRLSNRRLRDELRVRLQYPSVAHGLALPASLTAQEV
ncbi:MAG: NAD-dependent epimerase/dehydratase family protein [Betaproteobacteria bacterium]